MDAAPSALLEHDTDELAEAFFSRPPHTSDPVIEEWRLRPMRAIERLAMHVTLATLTCSVLCALALFLFRDVAVFPSAVSAQRDAVATPLAPVTMTAAIRSEHSTNSPSAGTTPVSPKQIATEVTTARAAATLVEATSAETPPVEAEPARSISATKHIAKPASDPVEARISSAYRELGRGNAGAARQLATQALQLDPTRARAYIVLGGAYDRLGDRSAMQATFRSCVARARDSLVSACKSLAR